MRQKMYIKDAELAGTTRIYLIARFMLYPDSLYRGTTCTEVFKAVVERSSAWREVMDIYLN